MTTAIWFPTRTAIDSVELLSRVEALAYTGTVPSSPTAVAMLDAISSKILKDPLLRGAPQYVALAYWLRRASLVRLTKEFASLDRAGQVRTPRGVALHLPPTNVDTIFVYSWAVSVLAGNSNVVRLPEAMSSEAAWLATTIATVVTEHGDGHRQIFCHYSYGGDLEAALARQCDLRMIWGGDEKVRAVSQCPVRPDGLSMGFPDRKSLAVIATQAYRNSDDAARNALAKNFFNDLFWFDQMGCGSPRLLVWLEEPGDLADDFYGRLRAVVAEKSYAVETGVTISKFALSHDLLAEGLTAQHRSFGNALHINRTLDPAAILARTHGGGFLCDWVAASLTQLAMIVSRPIQTITHFGVAPSELEALADALISRGGYRLVPIGQALQFDTVWDGVDLYEHMTRRIVIR